jgi:type II secretory pathway component PulF
MLKSWMRDITLSLQARSGVTPISLVWVAIVAVALINAFVFLTVAGYDWLTMQLGAVFAGLIMAGVFLCIALVGFIVTTISRRRAKERAIVERAARAQAASSWLLDPKILGIAMQAGRTAGWQSVVPIALIGFIAAQWLLGRRGRAGDEADTS